MSLYRLHLLNSNLSDQPAVLPASSETSKAHFKGVPEGVHVIQEKKNLYVSSQQECGSSWHVDHISYITLDVIYLGSCFVCWVSFHIRIYIYIYTVLHVKLYCTGIVFTISINSGYMTRFVHPQSNLMHNKTTLLFRINSKHWERFEKLEKSKQQK